MRTIPPYFRPYPLVIFCYYNKKKTVKRQVFFRYSCIHLTINANDLIKKEFPGIEWIIPGIIPEGLTILAGAPKTGKSWLALNIGIALSLGTYVLGNIKVDQREVLYLALEDTERRLQRRLTYLGVDGFDLNKLTFANNWKKGKKGFNDFLLWQRVNPDIKLIIVDTLQMIRESANYNTYESDYEEISKLKKISDMIDVPIIVLHHTRKQASNDPLFEVSGTLGITGAADTTLRIKRSRRHSTAELFITSRDIEEKEYALKFSEYIGWELLGDADDYRQTSERQEILNIIKNADEPISPKEIAEILGKNPDTVRGLIKKIKDEGCITSPAYGKYIYNPGNNINSINSVNG